jgi:hypothetical protein
MEAVEATWRSAGLDELDIVWNRAGSLGADGEAPDGIPRGVVQLSYLLRVYNSAMGGGLGFAVEVNEQFRLQRAIDAMHYFGLPELAALVADLLDHDLDAEYAESRQSDFDALLGPRDENLSCAYRTKATESPADFGLA